MLINPFNFEELIAPITPTEFFEEYWEKKPLLLTNRKAQGYRDLLNIKDVDDLLFSRQSGTGAYSSVRFFQNHNVLDIEDFTNDEVGRSRGFLNKRKVLSGFSDGMSINMTIPDLYFEPLHKICKEIERVTGHPNYTNIFLNPANAEGLRPHYDKSDVFVLQLEGKKHWNIYDILIPLPMVTTDTPYKDKLPAPIRKIVLKPGDFLYLPRGYVHETFTTKDYSLSLSLATDVLTWADLMFEMIKTEPEFRKALPIGALFSKNSKNIDMNTFQPAKKLFKDREKLELAFRKIKSRFAKRKRFEFSDSFPISPPKTITSKTLLKKKEGILCSIVTEGGTTTIHFGEQEFEGPSYLAPILEHIVDRRRFSINDLPTSLAQTEKKDLVQLLIKEGLLEVEESLKHKLTKSKKR